MVDKKSSVASTRTKYLAKVGVMSNSHANQRSSSNGSNYASDFSVNTGFNLANQREITLDEFQRVQQECMDLIRQPDDSMSKLDFKKKYNCIKSYCKP